MASHVSSAFRRIRRADAARPGFPGEHIAVLAAGFLVWLSTRGHRSTAVRAVGAAIGAALAARAASGRDGVRRFIR